MESTFSALNISHNGNSIESLTTILITIISLFFCLSMGCCLAIYCHFEKKQEKLVKSISLQVLPKTSEIDKKEGHLTIPVSPYRINSISTIDTPVSVSAKQNELDTITNEQR